MSETRNPNHAPQDNQNPVRLDDESRVKVLSPSQLVFKRFVRNRLAITGLIILLVMFVFSFLGGALSPYTQSQVFYKYESIWKDYVSVIENEELRYVSPEGKDFSLGARAQFILALNNGKNTFESAGKQFSWIEAGEDFYLISEDSEIATALGIKGKYTYKELGEETLSDDVKKAFEASQAAEETSFSVGDDLYSVAKAGKSVTISRSGNVALASMRIFDAATEADTAVIGSYAFRLAAEQAIIAGEVGFTADDVDYTVEHDDANVTIYKAGEPFAIGSRLIANAIAPDVFVTVDFKDAILTAIEDNARTFTFGEVDGKPVEYQINKVHNTYTIRHEQVSQLYDMYAYPSSEHWLGTDSNGMDMLTRLMYGGRISLLVGFVVVFIELIIGVLIGGVAGYFGGWIDTLLMRFIDLFNCIPYWPVMIIAGAVMDSFEVDPTARIFILMLILGIMGWTGIARVVRGQILTLREQDFMVATEATGIRVSRRIFRHLVPNVMPLLIVQATMSLGSIIITEATLSFLGLGLKYPMASWGTIINAATNIYVMTNYWFIWIPAGLLILLTVLGFNFVGDGLRDAFDPKMKR